MFIVRFMGIIFATSCFFVLLFFILTGYKEVNMTKKSSKASLKTYEEKRDFKKSPEPEAKKEHTHSEKLIFVVQEHHASHLHYDLRLEIDGVLKSWAVPKGVPTEPNIKHLAILTEDHPMEYAHFEGTIPEGNYGAGTVKIWDSGTYKNYIHQHGPTLSLAKEFDKGHLSIIFSGKKLHGKYELIRFAGRKENEWLLFKVAHKEGDA